jgi:serine/threonine protein kinase/tetratricopeptide (TPR) repeat protein
VGAGLANFVSDFFTTSVDSGSCSGAPPPISGSRSSAEAIIADVVVYSNHTLLAKYSIEHGEYLIGRDSACHILVDADQVSRHHARLTLSGFDLILEDAGSSNGVFIDGVQVQIPTRVRMDQEVQIGSARLRIGLRESASRQLAEALWDRDLGLEAVREMLEAKKYRVITTIAQGGMGVVMQARDLRIRRTVAMKVMKSSSQFSRESVLRFIDEAQLTGQLEHPNIVPVYELGIDPHGETFYTMKFVKGITLDDVIRGLRTGKPKITAKYPLAMLVTIFQKICDAVAFAHSKGVVHRDLKPENVMIGSYGEVLVMDWGLAKNLSTVHRDPVSPPPQNPSKNPAVSETAASDGRGFQTMNGVIVGTPPYISPEQARGELDHIDTRSDIYVLGEILYSILTLRPPVTGENVHEVVEKILSSQIPSPLSFNNPPKTSSRQPSKTPHEGEIGLIHCPGRRIPEGLSAVAMKAMNTDPDGRYQAVVEMQADITAWQGGFATKAERAGIGTHLRLFVGRHKAEVALLGFVFLIFNVVIVGLIYQLAQERNLAQESADHAWETNKRASEIQKLTTEVGPAYYRTAQRSLEEGQLENAFVGVDLAIAQAHDEPDYLLLRGRILQSMFRWKDALEAYGHVIEMDEGNEDALLNIDFTRSMLKNADHDGAASVEHLDRFHAHLLAQGRVDEAVALLKKMTEARRTALFESTWAAYFAKNKLGKFQVSENQSLWVDLSKSRFRGGRKLEKLRRAPVAALDLAESAFEDVSVLDGLPLKRLVLSHTPVGNIEALSRMPLEELSIDHCTQVEDLAPLQGLPVKKLDLQNTRVSDLRPLVGGSIRELNLQGCERLVDLQPLMCMTGLEVVHLPAQCQEIRFLKEHPNLKYISHQGVSEPVETFWAHLEEKLAGSTTPSSQTSGDP